MKQQPIAGMTFLREQPLNQTHVLKIASELSVRPAQVQATAEEATGSLDETVITAIRGRLNQLKELDARRDAIIKSLEERGQLTDELKEQILRAETSAGRDDGRARRYLPALPAQTAYAGNHRPGERARTVGRVGVRTRSGR